MEKKKLAVFFGGQSPEHEVSVITGLQVINNADKDKFEVIPVYISKQGSWHSGPQLTKIENYKNLDQAIENSEPVTLPPKPNSRLIFTKKSSNPFAKQEKEKIDVIFPCFHGGLGEAGGFQALVELAHIPYVGSGILGSATGMDKIVMKQIFEHYQIPVAKYHWFYRNDWNQNEDRILGDLERKLKYPMFVKPANAGSSIGINKVSSREELKNAIEVALAFDRKAIVEEGFTNAKEINVSVIGNSGSELKTSVCEEVFAKSTFLNYDDKYKGDSSKSQGMASATRKIPAELTPEMDQKVKATAKKVFEALDCAGLARIDFLVREQTNELIVIEINTIPGSMAFYLWEATGLSFKDMISKLINLAIERFEENQKNTTTFSSNILENYKPTIKAPNPA